MANDTILSQKRGIFSAIYHFLFGPPESQGEKQLKKNVAILKQNQNLQQPFIETNDQTNNIPHTCFAIKKHT